MNLYDHRQHNNAAAAALPEAILAAINALRQARLTAHIMMRLQVTSKVRRADDRKR